MVGLAVIGLWVLSSPAGERLSGPIGAQVLRVLDGDTLEVSARIWLGQAVETRVRLAGIDAPELRGGCAFERELAVRARAYLVGRLGPVDGRPVRVSLYDISAGKYGGRVLARVLTANGEDLGRSLLAAGLARPYTGGGRRSWCAIAG
ncbi:MAG: thermonuclease family protein [Alphaproteobacteria bacterium]